MPALPDSSLSDRERVIVAGVARGRTNREIGEDLGLKELGVKSCLRRIGRRYGVIGRAAIVQTAYQCGELTGLRPEPRTLAPLSTRELQVLDGMSRGMDNAGIGRELFLTEDTIKTHGRRLFRKLGARDRAHAVALGHQHGLFAAVEERAA